MKLALYLVTCCFLYNSVSSSSVNKESDDKLEKQYVTSRNVSSFEQRLTSIEEKVSLILGYFCKLLQKLLTNKALFIKMHIKFSNRNNIFFSLLVLKTFFSVINAQCIIWLIKYQNIMINIIWSFYKLVMGNIFVYRNVVIHL